MPFAVVVVFLTSLLLSSPFRLEQCCRCDDHRRQEDDGSSSNGAGPLLLTLGPLGPAADRRCSCVIAPAPATMSVLRGSRYLRPAQELLGEVVRMANLAAGAGAEDEAAADKQERLDAEEADYRRAWEQGLASYTTPLFS